jgi:c-di-GMP-binding flagellar brake protein YcgR
MSEAQRRRESRVKSRGLVRLHVAGREPLSGRVYDISESGISIDLHGALPSGQPVQVDCCGFVADAIVRHCAAVNGHYRIGLELLAGEGEPRPPGA